VAAHAVDDLSIRMAIEAGVDSIEHGYHASDSSLKLMAEKKIFLVPTEASETDPLDQAVMKTLDLSPEEQQQHQERKKGYRDQWHRRLQGGRVRGSNRGGMRQLLPPTRADEG
jgi:imidazolonepropionase-like amidohydrolase